MSHQEMREKFLKFFESRNHKIVYSSSLLPTDASVLFTTAGMQQFKPYYTNQKNALDDFGSLNTVSIQKCLRTSDIDEVGDESHLTFFEMLGNFSFGGYFKEGAIKLAHEFITKEMGLKIDFVSIFEGESDVPADDESEKIWKSLNPDLKIVKAGKKDNFWGPTGDEGPCGPTTEIYINGIEIWNLVFNQYFKHKDGRLEPLKTPGIDTGMGLERLAMVSQDKNDIFETDLFDPIFKLLPENMDLRIKRIVADHLRASAFLISDGILPSNKEQGYILRKLLRRVIVHLNTEITRGVLVKIGEIYSQYYPEINVQKIISEFDNENEKFQNTLNIGLKELDKVDDIDAVKAFKLYESYGLPYEIIKEIGGEKARKLTREAFDEEFKKHQEISRAGLEKKFGGHGIVKGDLTAGSEDEMVIKIKLHTATHLLHAALRKVLGNEVQQAGSDITSERLRFDFTFDRKLTTKEISKVEELINEAIKKDLPVSVEEMSFDDAIKSGALAFFKTKYPPIVSVYSINNPSNSSEPPFSREICGGPHVQHTGEIGSIKISKEESVSAGVRRVRAIIK